MKILLLTITLFSIVYSQTFSFDYGGNTRQYIVHTPPSYNPSNSYPLVINYHGYTSNMSQQMSYTQMNNVADTANFIVVYPDGIAASWNVGFGLTPYFTGIDDVGFTNALIDTMMANYSIDANCVYATGMSNGGYLSQRLACELPHRIAAIASVTGIMTDSTRAYCNPGRIVPVLHIHGTTDPIVNYNGTVQSLSVDEMIDFWKMNNACPSSASNYDYPNINLIDLCTAQRQVYTPCADNASVELIKITSGGHTWPGGSIDIPIYGNTNRDFNASGEIWNFFRRYKLNMFIGVEEEVSETWFNIHPNPAMNDLYISKDLEYKIFTTSGKLVLEGKSDGSPIQVGALKFGSYIVHMNNGKNIVVRKFMKVF